MGTGRVISLTDVRDDRDGGAREAARQILTGVADDLDADEARVVAVVGLALVVDEDGEEYVYLQSAGRHVTLRGALLVAGDLLGEE